MAAGIKITTDEAKKIVESFGFCLIDSYSKLWKTRVIIKDKFGYKYDVVLRNFINTNGKLNFVDKGNPFSLDNISLWLRYNKKDFYLCQDNIYVGTDNELKFHHNICNDDFKSNWHKIHSGQGCSICSGYQVGKYNNLKYLYPDIAIEWNYKKNRLKPEDFTCGSGYKAYWICSRCGYGDKGEWKTAISDRVQGNGCSACSGRIVTDNNRLSILFPDIANEWHSFKNKNLKPEDVSYGSNEKVWWKCSKGHEYFSSIKSRTKMGSGCRECAIKDNTKKRTKDNDVFVQQVFNLVGNEYSVLGEYINSKSKIKIKHNKCGCEWDVDAGSFLNGNRCPQCSESKGEKKVFILLQKFKINFETQKKFDKCINKRKLPFDFYLSDHHILIEYDGILHFEDKFNNPKEFKQTQKNDKIKTKYCKDNKIKLIRIPYWDFDNIEEILTKELGL